MKREKFMVSLRGVVIQNGKIMLVKEKEERRWETPGGGMKLGEKIEDCLRREFLEETGYNIEIVNPLTVFNRGDFIFVNFLVKLKNRIGNPLDDIIGIKWFTKEDVKRLLNKNDFDDHDENVFKMFVSGELK